MRAGVRNFLRLTQHQRRGRWALVFLIALIASAVEAFGAVVIYLLLRIVSDPSGGLALPILGDLRVRFPDAAEETLIAAVAGVMAVFFLARGAILLGQTYYQNRVAQHAGVQLSRRLLAGYLQMPYLFHVSRNSAETIRNAYQAVNQVVAYVLLPIVMLSSEALTVLALLVVLLINVPLPTLFVLAALVPLLLVILRFVQPRLAEAGTAYYAATEQTLRSIQPTLTGVREIKVLGREGYFVEAFERARRVQARASYIRAALTDVPRTSGVKGLPHPLR